MIEKKLVPLLELVLNMQEVKKENILFSQQKGLVNFDTQITDLRRFNAINEYALFLNTPLTLDMFYPNNDGELMSDEHPDFIKHYDKVIFTGFKPDISTFSHVRSISLEGILNVFWRDGTSDKWRLSVGLKTVDDLTKFRLKYIEK